MLTRSWESRSIVLMVKGLQVFTSVQRWISDALRFMLRNDIEEMLAEIEGQRGV
jgi:hypothetical protein